MDRQVEKFYEDIIEKLYKDCISLVEVHKWVMKVADVKSSRAYDYIRDAKAYFGKYMVDRDDNLLLECLEVLKRNREKAASIDNLKEVRECTKEIAKLQQLYVEKQEINHKGLSGITVNIRKK